MVIAFCGHADYTERINDEMKVLDFLETVLQGKDVYFYLGEYGAFDAFAYKCAKRFKLKQPNAKLVFITPYLDFNHKCFSHIGDEFDEIIYPELEDVPLKFAISQRNKWIVNKSDLLICYIAHNYGGAYSMCTYAKKKNKKIYNIKTDMYL